MNKLFLFIVMLLFNSSLLFSQVAVNTDGSAPDNSAIFDVNSTNKGVLIPRMTIEERNSISSPAEGLLIFCTNCGVNGSLSIYSNGIWQTFSPCFISAPPAGTNIVLPVQIIWKWDSVDGATGYKWNTVDNIDSSTDTGNEIQKIETISDCDTTFARYVWSYNTCAVSPETVLSQAVSESEPDAPTAGIQVPGILHITWNWSTVSGATGYKWNTANNIGTAIDMGVNTTEIETGLNCESEYTRYVWAYNGCGYSLMATLNQSTNECCGDSLTISHLVSGGVAPIDKTVTYGTVINIPGEPGKCWITSNLGADHQATAVDDATETSAGWYWQFNRMQGYMHDGTTVTPAWTITSINEYSDWLSANDPCTLELGSGWRLPTYTELLNVDESGGWTDWNGPWTSALKMHAAGVLWPNNGSLNSRGAGGFYWSSLGTTNYSGGFHLTVISSNSSISHWQKTFGCSARCLRD